MQLVPAEGSCYITCAYVQFSVKMCASRVTSHFKARVKVKKCKWLILIPWNISRRTQQKWQTPMQIPFIPDLNITIAFHHSRNNFVIISKPVFFNLGVEAPGGVAWHLDEVDFSKKIIKSNHTLTVFFHEYKSSTNEMEHKKISELKRLHWWLRSCDCYEVTSTSFGYLWAQCALIWLYSVFAKPWSKS